MKGRNAGAWALVLLIGAGCCPTAQAADPLAAMRQFGLLGTWDENCTAPITGAMVLIRFTETSLGEPRLIVSHPDEIIFETTIESAAPIPPDEIQLTVAGGLAAPRAMTFRLTAGALQLVSGGDAPVLHRCVSE